MKKILGLLTALLLASPVAAETALHCGEIVSDVVIKDDEAKSCSTDATGEDESACLKVVRIGSAPCKGGCEAKDESLIKNSITKPSKP